MTNKVLDMNELFFDINTVKTHHVNRSNFLKKPGFLDKFSSKKQFFYFQQSL